MLTVMLLVGIWLLIFVIIILFCRNVVFCLPVNHAGYYLYVGHAVFNIKLCCHGPEHRATCRGGTVSSVMWGFLSLDMDIGIIIW